MSVGISRGILDHSLLAESRLFLVLAYDEKPIFMILEHVGFDERLLCFTLNDMWLGTSRDIIWSMSRFFISALANALLKTNCPSSSFMTLNFIQSTRANGPRSLPITSSFPPNIFTIIVLLLSSSIVVTDACRVKVWLVCLYRHGKICHCFR
jgi:hypothetical protein